MGETAAPAKPFEALDKMEAEFKAQECTFSGDNTLYQYTLKCAEPKDDNSVTARQVLFTKYLEEWKVLAQKYPLADNRTGYVSRAMAVQSQLKLITDARLASLRGTLSGMLATITEDEKAAAAVQALVENQLETYTDDTLSAFLTVAAQGKIKTVQALITAGVKPEAAISGKKESLRSKRSVYYEPGMTALLVAAELHQTAIVKLLLQAGPTANAVSRGRGAMHYAYSTTNPPAELVAALEGANLSVNNLDADGNTVLMSVLKTSLLRDYSELIAKTDVKVKNLEGKTALDIAKAKFEELEKAEKKPGEEDIVLAKSVVDAIEAAEKR